MLLSPRLHTKNILARLACLCSYRATIEMMQMPQFLLRCIDLPQVDLMNFRVEYVRPKDLSESLSDALHFGGNFAAVFTLTITHFTLIGYDLHYENRAPLN